MLSTKQVDWLDEVFANGSAYSFGKVNGDCWHLYTTTSDHSNGVQLPDQTLELLMVDLDPEVMKYFYADTCVDGKMATKVTVFPFFVFQTDSSGLYVVTYVLDLFIQMSGIDTIVPKSVIDDFLFEPCGYSANGLLPNVSIRYQWHACDRENMTR